MTYHGNNFTILFCSSFNYGFVTDVANFAFKSDFLRDYKYPIDQLIFLLSLH